VVLKIGETSGSRVYYISGRVVSPLHPQPPPQNPPFIQFHISKCFAAKKKFADAQKTIVGTADSGSYTIWTSEPHDAAEEEKLVAQRVQERIELEDRM
jgi:hypothetical protein